MFSNPTIRTGKRTGVMPGVHLPHVRMLVNRWFEESALWRQEEGLLWVRPRRREWWTPTTVRIADTGERQSYILLVRRTPRTSMSGSMHRPGDVTSKLRKLGIKSPGNTGLLGLAVPGDWLPPDYLADQMTVTLAHEMAHAADPAMRWHRGESSSDVLRQSSWYAYLRTPSEREAWLTSIYYRVRKILPSLKTLPHPLDLLPAAMGHDVWDSIEHAWDSRHLKDGGKQMRRVYNIVYSLVQEEAERRARGGRPRRSSRIPKERMYKAFRKRRAAIKRLMSDRKKRTSRKRRKTSRRPR